MIELVNVSKYYHTKTSVSLGLRKINLRFAGSGFVAITGESGSGKSTLLNVISGSDTYEEGEMYFRGEKTSHYTSEELEEYRRNNMAFIYQGYNLIDSYTVLENVQVPLIIREDVSDLEDKAMYYLERVGLASRAENKAAQLSSGQKQRLAIARALAKGTDVIVADEPTGNLDVENGMQVMEILHELSKEKLVIVVTHNYELAERFATRKIRMFNGEVAEDTDICHMPDGRTAEKPHEDVKDVEMFPEEGDTDPVRGSILGEYVGFSKWDFRKRRMDTAWRFVKAGRKNQPKRNMFLFALFFFISFATLVFLGGIISNFDGALSGYYSDKAFKNGDMTRIVVRKTDGTAMTGADAVNIRKIAHVREVDMYDGVNDINYFMNLNDDYRMVYRKGEFKTGVMRSTYVELLKFDKYMRSAECLDESMLAAGSMPEAWGDIVLYSNDMGMIGKKIKIYLCNRKMWNKKQYVEVKCIVTGILKEHTDQVYFSSELCRIIEVDNGKAQSNLIVKYTDPGRGIDVRKPGVNIDSFQLEALSGNVVFFKNPIMIPAEGLDSKSIKMSSVFFDEASKEKDKMVVQHKVGREVLIARGEYTALNNTDIPPENLQEYTIIHGETGSSVNVIEVSYSLFNQFYPDLTSKQMSVYTDNYGYTDDVIKSINSAGYDALSVYRAGITSYDYDKAVSTITAMLISGVSLVFVFFIGMFIIYMLLKIKKGDFIIFKSIGMKQSQVREINYLDLFSGFFGAAVVSIFIAVLLDWLEIDYMTNIMAYYKLRHYILYFAVITCLAWMTGRKYSGYLRKHDGIINLKTED